MFPAAKAIEAVATERKPLRERSIPTSARLTFGLKKSAANEPIPDHGHLPLRKSHNAAIIAAVATGAVCPKLNPFESGLKAAASATTMGASLQRMRRPANANDPAKITMTASARSTPQSFVATSNGNRAKNAHNGKLIGGPRNGKTSSLPASTPGIVFSTFQICVEYGSPPAAHVAPAA